MALEILSLALGVLDTNCYIVGDSETGSAIVIDPSDRATAIQKTTAERGWTIREILATHAHFDHVLGSADLKALTGAPFRLHRLELPALQEMPQRVRLWMGIDVPPAAEPDGFVEEGDTIEVGGIALDVLFTPGHAPGHVSYVLRSEQVVFSGDCLFPGGLGRYDLPGADYETLMRSITQKLLPLGDDFTVATGHGPATTIGYERQHNHYLLEYLERQ